ncbi:GNAT family N-acetyltransferase [Runella sp.]|uniref:GNAT family N-acetyltransferase n=1 Tax=Runella sp. TaxID=1960881 RepID=UPI003D0AE617
MNNNAIFHGEYRIERLTIERLKDVRRLHYVLYGKKVSDRFWRRKYDTAYTEHIYIGFLAYNQANEPVGHYSVLPCFLQYNGQPVLAAQSVDTMTHPEHQKKGLFFTLATLTFELCIEEGIRLVFGFPNQNSLPGFVKLGWIKAGQLERFTIPVTTFPLERIVNKALVMRKIYNIYTNLMLKKYRLPKAFNLPISENYNGVLRDTYYFRYKTYSNTYTISVGNAFIWCKIHNGFVIGDMTGFEPDFDQILVPLKKLSAKLGLRQLHFQVSKQTTLYALLKKYSESMPSFQIMIKDLGSGIAPGELAFVFADIDIF